jgi:hypothetical protein
MPGKRTPERTGPRKRPTNSAGPGSRRRIERFEHDRQMESGTADTQASRDKPQNDADEADDARQEIPVDKASALGPPRYIEMTVVAQDPTIRDDAGRMVTATVQVPAVQLTPPFQSQRFNVVSYDATKGQPGRPITLLDGNKPFVDRFAKAKHGTLLRNRDFHAQNVFAVASRTLAAFEGALGRRVPWDFGSHQLFLVPHGYERANAEYSPANQALLFGDVRNAGADPVYACLSHDIIAHETTHAILAGLRPEFDQAGLPDQLAFHEAFADIVALLSVFSIPAALELGLGKAEVPDRISRAHADPANLRKSVLFQLGEEIGEVIHAERGRPLRASVELPPGDWWKTSEEFRYPHRRGEVLVAAIAQTMLEIWSGRLVDLLSAEGASRKRAAEEGAKAAEHLLRMCIRAVDYLPALEFEFEDFLDAIIVSDEQMVPDDVREHDYRGAVKSAFKRYGITRPRQIRIKWDKLPQRPSYTRFNFEALRSDRDEVFRFMWEGRDVFQLDLDYYTVVDSIRPATRVGPDGFVVRETVVTYHQALDAPARELLDLSRRKKHYSSTEPFVLPRGMGDQLVRILGGAAIIFDQFGRVKFHQTKPLLEWGRQTRRLRYLFEEDPEAAQFGVSSWYAGAARFAALHQPDPWASERW